jgi:hypothetical protein
MHREALAVSGLNTDTTATAIMRRKALAVSVLDTVITATAIMHRSALADIRPDFYKETLCRLFVLLDVTSIIA